MGIFRRKKTTPMLRELYNKEYAKESYKITRAEAIRAAKEQAQKDIKGGRFVRVGKRVGKYVAEGAVKAHKKRLAIAKKQARRNPNGSLDF